MSDLKNLYIYDADKSDEIRVDGKTVKARDELVPGTPVKVGSLRVTFSSNYQDARAQGVEERIDAVFYNAADHRSAKGPQEFPVLGRKSVTIELR